MTVADSHALATELLDFVDEQLSALAAGPLPGFELPGMLLGHPVGADVRADLLFTIGLARVAGREQVAGIDVADAVAGLLAGVRGSQTHTFYSYRIAETVRRFGRFDDGNAVLAPLDEAQRSQVAEAMDSTEWIELLDTDILPRNYAAVLARCEHARRALGLDVDDVVLDGLLDRVRSLLGGHLDDSNTAIGRYDVYTVDIHLFCEPLSAQLGAPWSDGAQLALDLVDRVAGRDGAAVPWGRSTGLLALCHTIELAGLVVRHDLGADRSRWCARAAAAAAHLGDWFAEGWATAHNHRSSDPYRGLDRRLQLTLDCLGKLADTAGGLLAGDAVPVGTDDLFADRDELVWFDRERGAGVWSYRDTRTAFVLPLVGASTSDYLPAPRNPGLHEVPVGADLATATPVVLHRDVRYAAGGLPRTIEHGPGWLRARYDEFPEVGHLESARAFTAGRTVTWRVDGRTLDVDERLTFDERVPHSVTLQVAEAADRPLRLEVECDAPHMTATLDVDGIAEYRSCWSSLPRVHQVDIAPSPAVSLRWRVTPLLRVVSSAAGHHYDDALRAPMADRVRVAPLDYPTATNPTKLRSLLTRTDQLHVHWPEWFPLGPVGADSHRRFIDEVKSAGVGIVWTMHNLVPHSKDPDAGLLYDAWAAAADLVLHHSRWGMDRARTTYRYAAGARHVVVPHGHFPGSARRPSTETIRIGIVGAPRVEKDVELAMRAMARCSRGDIELHVLSLRGDEAVPDDPRVVASRYEEVPRVEYDRRLAGFDALLMPFDPDGDMLTTGTAGDAIGFGLPTIASSWPYLAEALGDAAVVYGRTEDDLITCLENLDRDALDRASAAAVARQPSTAWATVAETIYAELDRLGSTKH